MMTAQEQPAPLHLLYYSKQEVFLHVPDRGKASDIEDVTVTCHTIGYRIPSFKGQKDVE
jgi:hypothetical protein